MFNSYLKIAIRNIVKSKLHSFVNIFGLAVAIAASILIFLFAHNELTYDSFHQNAESIHLVYKERITPTGTQITRDTWVPMAEALRNDYPEIINATRQLDRTRWVEYGEKRLQENVTYADPSLLEMLTLPLIEGDPQTVFSDLSSVIISQEMAQKYFGASDPIGETITINYDTDYTVRGIFAEIPQNTIMPIDILAPFESIPGIEEQRDNWGGSFLFTFVQLSDQTTAGSLEEKFPKFVAKIWDEKVEHSMNLKLLPFLDLYNELTGADTYAYILLIIAFVILVIASINFTNLSIARSMERVREIGMRKVLGANRPQLIRQFLSESILLCIVALILGIGFAEFFLPAFNDLYELSLALDYSGNAFTILALLGLGLIVGIVSGSYPAFFLSRFQPNESLKGKLKSSRAGLRLRGGLVVTQFALSIILIIGTGVMWQQIQFMKNANLNFDKENVIAVQVEPSDFANREQAQARLETLKNTLRQNANILSVASSSHIPGNWPGWFTFAYPTDRDETQRLRMRQAFIDHSFFEAYGIDFIEGRNFSEELATDADESLIINESALKDIGWASGKERQIRIGDNTYNIIGVVKDYHYRSLAFEAAPVLHRYRPPENGVHNFISVRTTSQSIPSSMAFIKKQLHELDPYRTFDLFIVGDNFERLYENEDRLATVAGAFTILAIVIACLGLFALASLIVTQRTKEIGVRKALGATVSNIVLMLTKDFTKFVVFAFIIASPLAFYAMNQWLADFANRTTIGWEVFAIGGLLAFLVACITISFHSIRAALSNPVESLRYE